jgi:hypothetical protein
MWVDNVITDLLGNGQIFKVTASFRHGTLFFTGSAEHCFHTMIRQFVSLPAKGRGSTLCQQVPREDVISNRVGSSDESEKRIGH